MFLCKRCAQIIQIMLVLILGACATATTPSPTITPEELVAPTPTQSPPTPAQESIPTPLPEADIEVADANRPLSPNGPWWLVVTPGGIWVSNADGSGLTDFRGEPPIALTGLDRPAVASSAGRLAFLTGDRLEHGVQLHVLTLPHGDVQTIATLLQPGIEYTSQDGPGSIGFEAMTAFLAIREHGSYEWSPDGELLAFMGMIDGPSSDLYLFDPGKNEITRLTDGPSHGYRVIWSPDGRYILHAGVSSFGTGAGYSMEGVWAARADGSGVKEIDVHGLRGDFLFHGWISDTTFVASSFNALCGTHDVRSVDIESGEVITLWSGTYEQFAWDPDSGAMLLTIDPIMADWSDCNPSGLSYLVFVDPESRQPRQLVSEKINELRFTPQAGRFFARAEEGVYEISIQGQIARSLPAIPAVSPDGYAWAYLLNGEEQAGVFVGSPLMIPTDDVNPRTFPSIMRWDRQGEHLLFVANGILYVARPPDFDPVLVSDAIPGLTIPDIVWTYWVEP